MALSLRTGIYGEYWGNDYNSSNYLNQAQMEINAIYIYNALSARLWTLNAISGLLGNLQAESTINPGCWQNNDVGIGPAYGLVQWDPFTKYTNWAEARDLDPSEIDSNIARIYYEIDNDLQWIPTADYNFSFEYFTHSTNTPEYLASAFLKNYERAGVEVEEERRINARNWYIFLGGQPTPSLKKRKFPWVLYSKKLRNKSQIIKLF